MKIKIILSFLIIFLALVITTIPQSMAQNEDLVPDWIENTAGFWVEGHVGDQEFLNAMKHLIEKGIITVSHDDEQTDSKEVLKLKSTISELESKVSHLQAQIDDHQKNKVLGPGVYIVEKEGDPGNKIGKPLTGKADCSSFGLNLQGCDLTGMDLVGINLQHADLSWADLTGANLTDADLSGANLQNSNLSEINLSGKALRYTDFTGANLSGSNLSWATLLHVNFSYANLSNTNLSHSGKLSTSFYGADTTNANLKDMIWISEWEVIGE